MYIKSISLTQKNSKLNVALFYNILYFTLSIFLVVTIVLIILNPTKYLSSVSNGLNLFIISVFPSLFPFFVISSLLTNLGFFDKISKKTEKLTAKIFNVPSQAGYIFIMSILCGYPVGAKLISDYYSKNLIDEYDAKKILPLASSSGPIFIVGTVGAGLFNEPTIGLIILISHIISIIITALIFRGKKRNFLKKHAIYAKKVDNILNNSINSAIFSILTVGAYITIFYLFIDVLFDSSILLFISKTISKIFNIDLNISSSIASGLVEMTRGIKDLSILDCNNIIKIVISSFLISFGGLSIILQSMAFLNLCKIKMRTLLIVKFTQGIISIIVSYVICLVFLIF